MADLAALTKRQKRTNFSGLFLFYRPRWTIINAAVPELVDGQNLEFCGPSVREGPIPSGGTNFDRRQEYYITLCLRSRKSRGRSQGTPDRLEIEGDWRDAMGKAIKKKRPKEGWPESEKEKKSN